MAEATLRFSEPEVLTDRHNLAEFNSGEAVLDDWLRNRALDNLAAGASRTYVSCEAGALRVAAYYALAMGSIASAEAQGSMRRNMPKMIPSVMLARLAVDRSCQGHGLGRLLLRDAILRSLRAASEISARLVLVHALSPAAEAFYRHHGFISLPGEARTLALDLIKVAKTGLPEK